MPAATGVCSPVSLRCKYYKLNEHTKHTYDSRGTQGADQQHMAPRQRQDKKITTVQQRPRLLPPQRPTPDDDHSPPTSTMCIECDRLLVRILSKPSRPPPPPPPAAPPADSAAPISPGARPRPRPLVASNCSGSAPTAPPSRAMERFAAYIHRVRACIRLGGVRKGVRCGTGACDVGTAVVPA